MEDFENQDFERQDFEEFPQEESGERIGMKDVVNGYFNRKIGGSGLSYGLVCIGVCILWAVIALIRAIVYFF